MSDAEVLFLIDNQEAQLAKAHILRHKRMRADDDIDATVFQALLHRLYVSSRDQTRDLFNTHWETGEALNEVLKMLTAE